MPIMKLVGKPLSGGPSMTLAAFDDPIDPIGYMRGLLWVGYRPRTRIISWTEGVRTTREGWIDYANLHPAAQAIWSECEALMKVGHVLPRIE